MDEQTPILVNGVLPLLEFKGVDTGYEKKQVIYDFSIAVPKGEVVALIGPNGAGKSTVLKVAFGLLSSWGGEILFGGEPIHGASPAQNIARGMSFCPQGGRIFGDLTVLENLELGSFHLPVTERKERIEEIFRLFPVLTERPRQAAGKLSGGQRQTLALGRALVSRPALLLLDEPSLGLSPKIMRAAFEQIARINQDLGTTVLIVEHKVRAILALCDRVYGLKLGRSVFCGNPNDLKVDTHRLRNLFL